MYYGSNRATAIALSTMLIALLLASSFASIPIAHGQASATISPSAYPVFCKTTGNLEFTFNTGGATWRGVAIELPKEFIGLADGDTSKVYAPDITYDPRFISVFDEELYYPYSREYYWVEICANLPDYPNVGAPSWSAISGTKTVTLLGITAPSVARDYTFYFYYTTDYFPCTYNLPTDFSDGNRGNLLSTDIVKVHMREEASTISGTVYDATYSPPLKLNTGYVTATGLKGPLKGDVVAKTPIASDGSYTLTGLYEGTYTLTAWGKRAADGTVAAYIPTELPAIIAVGRHVTITGVNIAVNRGGEISGNVYLYDQVGTPTTPSTLSGFTLPAAGLPVRLELVDSAGTVVWDTTVYVPATASSASYSIKELYDCKGIPTGIYALKAYAFGFVQTVSVTVYVTAPGGVTIDVPIVKGGGISGTIYYLTAQGVPTTLAPGETILVEAFNSTGALRGVWIGTTTVAVSSTTFLIRGTGESITPVAPSGHITVALKTYSGRGVKDGGLPDGTYTIKVSVKGFIHQPPYPMVVIYYGGTGSVSIYLKQGGTIGGTIYAMDPTGIYHEYWAKATPPPWEYNPTMYPNTRIRAYIYDATGTELGYATTYQSASLDYALFSFSGRSRTTAELQCGLKQTALADGTYTVQVYTWGYWQAKPYPTATIYSGGTVAVDCYMRRGGAIGGRITFKEAGAPIPGGVTGLAKVEAIDTEGVTQGVAFYSLQAAQYLDYAIYGKYKYGKEFDGGLVDGDYAVKLTLKDFTHPPQIGTIVGGSTATVNFDAYRMGMVTGTVRGEVTYQPEPVPLSWVEVTCKSGSTVYTTYSADGSYAIRVPDGTYRMRFEVPGYRRYQVWVTVSSGAIIVVSADLKLSFEPYHDP